MRKEPVVMVNLIGDDRCDELPGVRLHWYDKGMAKPGRKMGHYNVLGEGVETVLM